MVDEDRVSAVISGVTVDSPSAYLASFDMALRRRDLAEAENKLIAAESLWTDNVLLKCRRAELMYATAMQLNDNTYLDEADQLCDVLAEEKSEDRLEDSWHFYLRCLVSLARKEKVPNITKSYCKEHDLYYALVTGQISGFAVDVQSLVGKHDYRIEIETSQIGICRQRFNDLDELTSADHSDYECIIKKHETYDESSLPDGKVLLDCLALFEGAVLKVYDEFNVCVFEKDLTSEHPGSVRVEDRGDFAFSEKPDFENDGVYLHVLEICQRAKFGMYIENTEFDPEKLGVIHHNIKVSANLTKKVITYLDYDGDDGFGVDRSGDVEERFTWVEMEKEYIWDMEAAKRKAVELKRRKVEEAKRRAEERRAIEECERKQTEEKRLSEKFTEVKNKISEWCKNGVWERVNFDGRWIERKKSFFSRGWMFNSRMVAVKNGTAKQGAGVFPILGWKVGSFKVKGQGLLGVTKERKMLALIFSPEIRLKADGTLANGDWSKVLHFYNLEPVVAKVDGILVASADDDGGEVNSISEFDTIQEGGITLGGDNKFFAYELGEKC